MPDTLNLKPRLPGRYVIHHHVASPLTCRHKHRCACHGEPPTPEKVRKKAEDTARAEMDRKMIEIASVLALALKPFPDAREAVNQALREHELRRPS